MFQTQHQNADLRNLVFLDNQDKWPEASCAHHTRCFLRISWTGRPNSQLIGKYPDLEVKESLFPDQLRNDAAN